jgi:hypothetical protein
MKFKLDLKKIRKDLNSIGSVEVGVPMGMKASVPDYKKPQLGLKGYASVKRNQAKRRKSKTDLSDVLEYLNKDFELFAIALRTAPQRQIDQLTEYLLKASLDNRSKKRLENLVIAILREPILAKSLGSNKKSTIKAKGFNRVGVNTGNLFKEINAEFKPKRR